MKNALVLVVTVIGFEFSFAAPQSVEDDFSQTSVEVYKQKAENGDPKAKEKLAVYAKKSKDGQYRLVQVSVLGLCESIYDDSADLVAEEMTAAEEYLSNPQVLAKLNLRQKATAELFNAVLESKIRKNFYRIKDGKVEGGSFYHAYRLAAEYPTSYFAHWAYEKMLEWSRMMSDESGANDTTTVSSAEMKRRIRQGLKVERSKKVDNGRNLLDQMCKSLDESKIWRGGMSRDSVMCILDIPKDIRTAYDIAVPCWKRDFTRFSFHGIGLGMQIDEISVLGKRTHVDELGDEGDAYLLNRPILGFTHCRLEVTPNYGEVRKILIFGGGDIGAVRSELVSQGVVFPRERSVRYGTNVDVAECGDVRITLGERGGFSILDTKADARDGGRFEGKGDKKNAVLISRLSSEIRMTKRWIDESNEIANGASGVCGLMLGMSIAEVLKQKSLWATWDYCGITNEGVRVEKDSIEFDLTDLMKNKRSADRRIHLVLQKPFRGMKDAYLEFTPLSRLHKIELLARWDGSDGGIEDELSVILDLLAKKFSRVDAPIGFTDYKINEKNSLSMLESQFLRIENGIIQPNVRFHWCLVRTHITNRKGWIFEHGNGASYGTRLTAYKKQVSLDSFDSESLLGNASMKSGYQKAFCLESDAVLFHDECRVRLDALERERSGLEGEVKKATQEDLDAL